MTIGGGAGRRGVAGAGVRGRIPGMVTRGGSGMSMGGSC